MEFVAKARYVDYSPYKLRPVVDVIRGKNALAAINWLATYKTQRSEPIKKVLASAIANAKSLENVSAKDLIVQEVRVDQGPIHKYFKPGAQGRASMQRKRFCHICIKLKSIA
jgi:large subunit ribosomal protein L22